VDPAQMERRSHGAADASCLVENAVK